LDGLHSPPPSGQYVDLLSSVCTLVLGISRRTDTQIFFSVNNNGKESYCVGEKKVIMFS